MESSFESLAGRPSQESSFSGVGGGLGAGLSFLCRSRRFPLWRYLGHTEDTNKRLLQHGPNLKHF